MENYIAMENQHFSWDTSQTFDWAMASIAMCYFSSGSSEGPFLIGAWWIQGLIRAEESIPIQRPGFWNGARECHGFHAIPKIS